MLGQEPKFGKLNRNEPSTKSADSNTEPDFERDRPMYERIRHLHPDMNNLLKHYDGIVVSENSGNRHPFDAPQKKLLEEQITNLYRHLSGGK